MSSEVIKKENTKVTLKIVVDDAQFEEAIKKAYNKMKSRFNLQGFRKGKAPRKIIEKFYGIEVFYEEAFNIVLPEAFEAAIEENNIEPISQPEIDIEEMESGKGATFTAAVEVMPEIEVKDYKGIQVEKIDYNVQEEDVEKELYTMVEQNARMIAIEDRPVKDGDMVIIDYKGMVDGEIFEGGTAERQSLTIGSGQFIPGFEEQLIGKNIEDEVEVKVTFPEEYHSQELAGKEAIFEVKVHEIKEKELPEIDDEFAKDVSEFDTLEELKNDIKAKLEEGAKNKAEQELRNSVVEAVANTVEAEIPKAAIDRQVGNMLSDFDYRLQSQGINLQSYFQLTGTTEEELREQMKGDAEKTVKNELVLEKIGKEENIEATEEELEEQLKTMAAQYNQELDKIKSNLSDRDLKYIKEGIIVRKTIDFLVENAKIA